MAEGTPPQPAASFQQSPNPTPPAAPPKSPERSAEEGNVENWNIQNPDRKVYASSDQDDTLLLYSKPNGGADNLVATMPTNGEPIFLTSGPPPKVPQSLPAGMAHEGDNTTANLQATQQAAQHLPPNNDSFPPSAPTHPSIDPNAVKEQPSQDAMKKALKTEGPADKRMKAVQETLMKAGYVIKGGADGLYGPSTQAALTDYLRKAGQDEMGGKIEHQHVSENPADHFKGQTENGMRILDGQPPLPTQAHLRDHRHAMPPAGAPHPQGQKPHVAPPHIGP